ncbi:GNAT family N-acetyltransferase [Demequina sp.]|uniref:GNAT family N-acetyltransferase n=1 Tax=Demequina sp. TaxID=2050685 RepID=UPI0025BA5A08|nr:GNAT family N-acetyltransferase [Demequina sp.]
MLTFAPVVEDFWQGFLAGRSLAKRPGFRLTLNPGLADDRRVVIRTLPDGTVEAALHPAAAAAVALGPDADESGLRAALDREGIVLAELEHVWYYPVAERAAVEAEPLPPGLRALTDDDAEAFAAFHAANSEADRDEAFVELDHWAVFGQFEGDQLVSVASAYPWREAALADIGVLTTPSARGKGYGRAVVRAIAAHVYAQEHEPLYRCGDANAVSQATARSAGMAEYCTWQTVESAEDQ